MFDVKELERLWWALAGLLAVSAVASAQSVTYHAAYTLNGGTASQTGQSYTATAADTSGVWVANGGVLTLESCTVQTSGDTSSQESSSFYGLNAGVLAAQGTITMTGGSVSTTGAGANGVFAYGGGSTVSLVGVTIAATDGGGHAVMASGGGRLFVTDVDMTTAGPNSGAIATDRGGGTIVVSGGSVLTTGPDSPGIYSTGDITVSAATISATGSESAVIEGENSITLTDSSLASSMEGKWGVMIYQSMSGDATGTRGVFTMTGGSLANTAATGPLFFVTNSTGVITLSGVAVVAGSGTLLEAGATTRWGTSGHNGGHAELTAEGETLVGDLVADDDISSIVVTLAEGTTLRGAVDAADLTLDATSAWEVTASSVLGALESAGTIGGAGTVSASSVTLRGGTVSAALTGPGGLTKTTATTATLAGANSYTGATHVAGGTLDLTGSLASSEVSVASGAALAGTGTMSGNLSLASGAGLVLRGSGHLTVGGDLAASGTVMVVAAADPLPAGTYTLLAYGGTLSGSPTFVYSSPSGQTAAVDASRPGEVTVTVGGAAEALFPAVASQPGLNGTEWRTELVLSNPTSEAQSVTLEILARGSSAVVAEGAAVLSPGQTLRTLDLFADLGAPSGAGMLRVTGPALSWARTYNQRQDGTLGQDLPRISPGGGFVAGLGVFFPVATPADVTTDFRSNLVLVNLGASAITCALTSGDHAREVEVPAGAYLQVNDVGNWLGLGPGTAVVEVTGSGSWTGFVSSIDPVLGDPTTMAGLVPSGDVVRLFPGVASLPGENGTEWRSQAVIASVADGETTVVLELLPRDSPDVAASASVALAAGEVLDVPDLYALVGASAGAGMLRVTGEALTWVRSYNQGPDATFGQDLPPVAPDGGSSAGDAVAFPVSAPTDIATDFRSNLTVVSLDASPLTVTVTALGLSRSQEVPAGASAQVNDVGSWLDLPSGRATVTVAGDGRWAGLVSTVDPGLGDPTTVIGLPCAE